MNPVLFLLLAALTVASALTVVVHTNPVHDHRQRRRDRQRRQQDEEQRAHAAGLCTSTMTSAETATLASDSGSSPCQPSFISWS